MSGIFTAEQLAAYQRDGYLVAPALFDAEEVDLLQRAAKEDKALDDNAFGRADGAGGSVRSGDDDRIGGGDRPTRRRRAEPLHHTCQR